MNRCKPRPLHGGRNPLAQCLEFACEHRVKCAGHLEHTREVDECAPRHRIVSGNLEPQRHNTKVEDAAEQPRFVHHAFDTDFSRPNADGNRRIGDLQCSRLDTFGPRARGCLADEQLGHVLKVDRISDVVDPVCDRGAPHAQVFVGAIQQTGQEVAQCSAATLDGLGWEFIVTMLIAAALRRPVSAGKRRPEGPRRATPCRQHFHA
jgi:hypothetical protein